MVSVLSIDLVRLMFYSQVMETVLESQFALLTVFQNSCCIRWIRSSSASILRQSYYVLSATSSIYNTLINMRTSEFVLRLWQCDSQSTVSRTSEDGLGFPAKVSFSFPPGRSIHDCIMILIHFRKSFGSQNHASGSPDEVTRFLVPDSFDGVSSGRRRLHFSCISTRNILITTGQAATAELTRSSCWDYEQGTREWSPTSSIKGILEQWASVCPCCIVRWTAAPTLHAHPIR